MGRMILTLRKICPWTPLGGDHTEMPRCRCICFRNTKAVWPECVTLISTGTAEKYFHFYAFLEASMSIEMGASQAHHIIIGLSAPSLGVSFFSGPTKPQTISSALTMFPRMPFSIQGGVLHLLPSLKGQRVDTATKNTTCHVIIFFDIFDLYVNVTGDTYLETRD